MTPAAVSICPYIGLRDDPDSSVAFPSNANYCHHSQPVCAVRLNHQEEFCLKKSHTACPIFQRAEKSPLPKHIRAQRARDEISKKDTRKTVWTVILVLALFFILLGVGWYFFQPPAKVAPEVPTARRTLTATPFLPATLETAQTLPPQQTESPSPSSTPTLHIPRFATATISPTSTPSVTPIPFVSKHQMEVPIGTDRKFIIYRISERKSLDPYIQKHSTSFKAVQSINYYLRFSNSITRRDMLVVFPIGFTNVSGLRALNVYRVEEAERGVNFEYIAKKFKCALSDLEYYNGIKTGERPYVGDYLLIPTQYIIP